MLQLLMLSLDGPLSGILLDGAVVVLRLAHLLDRDDAIRVAIKPKREKSSVFTALM